jgi:hypothetical protein
MNHSPAVHPVNEAALQVFVETLQLKAYSKNTIRTYRNEFIQLLGLLKSVPVESLSKKMNLQIAKSS